MSALAEIRSNLWQYHKGKIAAGIGLVVASACGINYLLQSGQQDPTIKEITPIIHPTDDFGSGGGGTDQLGLSDIASEGCIYIHNLPHGRQTTWSALEELSSRNDWLFPREGSVVLMHRLGDREGPFSIQEAVQTKSLVHNGDSWCTDPTQ